MKKTFATLLFCLYLGYSYAQPITDTAIKLNHYNEWTKIMETDPSDKWSRFGANISFQVFNRFSSYTRKDKSTTSAVISFYGNATLSWLNGQEFLELAAAGITKANADSFLYHVVLNDSIELVPWQHPTTFKSNKKGTYAYLGKFNSLYKLLKFEIYHISQYYDKRTVYFNNLYTPAASIDDATLYYNDIHLFQPHKQHYIPASKQIRIGGPRKVVFFNKNNKPDIVEKEVNNQSFEWSDSINHLALSIKPTLLNDMYYVYIRHYSEKHSDTSFISNKWNISYYTKSPQLIINAAYFKKPGNYEIFIVPKVPEDFKYTISTPKASLFFSVKPSSIVQYNSKQAIIYTSFILLIGGSGLFYYRDRSKKKLAKKTQEKQQVSLQLKAVRAQLNPHFMFNALAGIQNLMNKNETDKASNYLSRFARITGHILNEKEDDMTSILDEVKLLEDYLTMEQLRFGFQYGIVVDETIDQAQTVIPSMLLQPLIENAVKHGIAGLREQGLITLKVNQQSDNITLQVIDNGPGFSSKPNLEGHGLKLIKERITLLNKLYPESNVFFDVLSIDGHTACQITLNKWS